MNDALHAVLIAVALILVPLLLGSILYIVIRDAIKRNLRKE
jgi:hypothetical protein